jgi:hypothetical protein
MLNRTLYSNLRLGLEVQSTMRMLGTPTGTFRIQDHSPEVPGKRSLQQAYGFAYM